MTKKIYVGNLPFQVTEADLRETFAQFGPVESIRLITDRETGRSRGFGFVVMAGTGADTAMQELNGTFVEGRALTVNEARPMPPKEFQPRQNDYLQSNRS